MSAALRWTAPSDSGSWLGTKYDFASTGIPQLVARFTTPLAANQRSRWLFEWAPGINSFGNVSDNPTPGVKPTDGHLDVTGGGERIDGTLLIYGSIFNVDYSTTPADRVLKVVYTSRNFMTYAPGSVAWSYVSAAVDQFWVNRISCTEK